jgi:hypothetical protein
MFSVVTDRPAGAELSSMIDEICRTGAQGILLGSLAAAARDQATMRLRVEVGGGFLFAA